MTRPTAERSAPAAGVKPGSYGRSVITALVPVRGRIYYADIGYGDRPFLVVSNDRRKQSLESVLAVRITTSQKPAIPTVVRLAADDPVTGFALCDDLASLYGTRSDPTLVLLVPQPCGALPLG